MKPVQIDLPQDGALSIRADALDIAWTPNERSSYPTIWLRDNCPSGLHPQTRERMLDLLSLDPSPILSSAKQEGDCILLEYADGHVSRMPVALLSEHRLGSTAADPASIVPTLWRRINRMLRA